MKEILYYGHPTLRKKCREVEAITPEIKKIVEEMVEICKTQANAAALAAPQIGYDLRIFVNTFSKEKDDDGWPVYLEEPEVFINPVITKRYRRKWTESESCLSIPGISGKVERPYEIDIEYTDLNGNRIVSKKEKDWRARCIQHEYDHLDGILYPDIMKKSDLKRIEPSLTYLESKTKEKMGKSISLDDFMI